MKSFAAIHRRLARVPVLLGLLALVGLVASVACEDATPVAQDSAPAEIDRPPSRIDRESRGDSVRSRAEDAFAEMDEGFTRSESRVGPQPWPDDLPSRWPTPSAATVVADTKQASGERLLLVDLPDTPEHALEAFSEALEANGYRVERPGTRRVRHALHAENAEHEAVLTFVAREKVTRLEILILGRSAG